MFPKRLFASIEGLYTSPVEGLTGTQIGGFFIANATLSSPEARGGLSVSASAYNLFNKRYADAAGPGLTEIRSSRMAGLCA